MHRAPRIITTYDFRDERQELLFQVVRYEGKQFRQRRPDPNHRGEWIWDLKGVRRVLYRLPELLAAPASTPVFVVEGEKDVEQLRAIGLVATCNPGGAGKWQPEFGRFFEGRDVIIIPDNDRPGCDHADQVVRALRPVALSVRRLELPGLPEHGDVSDWLAAGHTKDHLLAAARETSPQSTAAVHPSSSSGSSVSYPAVLTIEWPAPLGEAAYHGPVGEFVRVVEPHTEADPASLLIQALVVLGNVIGRGAYTLAEADRHGTNLFAVLVGETAKGRKGTSWGHVRRLGRHLDETWADTRVQEGLSSGEGLTWAVRDPIQTHTPVREHGRVVGYEDVETDPGIADKRLLVVESEFASVLRVLQREGNTLSATVRAAWDTGLLRTMTKNNPAVATGAHVSIIGHVTKDELRRYLDRTETGNGFANRFLRVCARRARVLPEGGRLDPAQLQPVYEALDAAVVFARGLKEVAIERDGAARALWFDVYERLSEGRPGLSGAVTSRAEVQVLRLSSLYALLDQSPLVQRPHLEAALEVWRYCEDSARYVFGATLGDPAADALLAALRDRPEGLTRTEINNQVFRRNLSANQIGQALNLLEARGLACRLEVRGSHTPECWIATNGTNSTKLTNSRSDAPLSPERRSPLLPVKQAAQIASRDEKPSAIAPTCEEAPPGGVHPEDDDLVVGAPPDDRIVGGLVARTDGALRPVSQAKPQEADIRGDEGVTASTPINACSRCRSRRFWRTKLGVFACAVCSPPEDPRFVDERVNSANLVAGSAGSAA